MEISGKVDQKTIKYLVDRNNLPTLHGKHNTEFELPLVIKTSIQPSKMLNAKLINDDIFSFSFVRHPYTRYVHKVPLQAVISLQILLCKYTIDS